MTSIVGTCPVEFDVTTEAAAEKGADADAIANPDGGAIVCEYDRGLANLPAPGAGCKLCRDWALASVAPVKVGLSGKAATAG